jgi:hypothetical protein
MADFFLRRHPQLRPALTGVDNACAAWQRMNSPLMVP